MYNNTILQSVEGGYMSVEEARRIILGSESFIFNPLLPGYDNGFDGISDLVLGNSGSNYYDGMGLIAQPSMVFSNWATPSIEKIDKINKVTCGYCRRKNDLKDEVCESCGAVL
jgi:hypothetical protein